MSARHLRTPRLTRHQLSNGHLDLCEPANGAPIGYLSITDPLVGELHARPFTGAALAELLDRVEADK